ncbi:DUF2520 domain-containing protein [bacterium SCSIO 12741]|nr:DUF2520 domain-containing protein [bacterium SCSIO 12741]
MSFKTATLIGSGNVAHVLGKALVNAGLELKAVYSRNSAHSAELAQTLSTSVIDSLSDLPSSDLIFLAVSDDQIGPVSEQLPVTNAMAVHCSGAKSLEEIRYAGPKAVFYPFQSFTKGRDIGLKQVPIFLEVSQANFLEPLSQLALSLGANPYEVSSENRRKLHLAGVIANNFTNHLFQLSMDWLESQQLPKAVLYPLLFETLSKAIEMGPDKAQTGPARRGDSQTVEKHLAMLADDPNLQGLYQSFTESIQRGQSSDPNSLSS